MANSIYLLKYFKENKPSTLLIILYIIWIISVVEFILRQVAWLGYDLHVHNFLSLTPEIQGVIGLLRVFTYAFTYENVWSLIFESQILYICGVLLEKKIDRSLLIQLIVLSIPVTGFTFVLLSQALDIEGVYAGMGFVIAMLSFCTFVLYLADWQQSLKLEKILVVCLSIYFLLNLIAYSNYFVLYFLNIVLSIIFLKNLKEQELKKIKSFLGRLHFRFRQKITARMAFYVGATFVIFLFFWIDLFYASTTDFLQSLFTMFFVLWLYGSIWIFFFRPCLNERYLVYIKVILILGLSLSIISIWFDFLSITMSLFDVEISAMAILYNSIILLFSILFLMAFGTIKIIRKIF